MAMDLNNSSNVMISINNDLLDIQKKWFIDVIIKTKIEHPEYKFSNPFVFALNEEYVSSKNKMMIVGQQTAHFGSLNEDIDLAGSQKWSEDYINKQLTGIGSEKYNRSPFWNFFRRMSKEGFGICWNNVDSIQRIENKEAKALTIEMEEAVQVPFDDDRKTLLIKQIAVADPKIILFITGPHYIRTMEMALMLKEGCLEDIKPSTDEMIKDISPFVFPKDSSKRVLWTYHPNFLYRRGIEAVNSIVERIKAGCE